MSLAQLQSEQEIHLAEVCEARAKSHRKQVEIYRHPDCAHDDAMRDPAVLNDVVEIFGRLISEDLCLAASHRRAAARLLERSACAG